MRCPVTGILTRLKSAIGMNIPILDVKPSSLATFWNELKMKPNDIYNAPFISETTELCCISEFVDYADVTNSGVEDQTRITVRKHFNPYIDGTRSATLYSVWYDGLPVMVCMNGGRPDREYSHRFITNEPLYCSMLVYIQSLCILEYREAEDVVDPNQDIAQLDRVYTFSINVNDLGRIPHERYHFLHHWLIPYHYEGGWPYGSIIGVNEKGTTVTRQQLSLEEKKRQRWERIQTGAKRLAEHDPEAKPLLELAEGEPNDEAVTKMRQFLEDLLKKSGVA